MATGKLLTRRQFLGVVALAASTGALAGCTRPTEAPGSPEPGAKPLAAPGVAARATGGRVKEGSLTVALPAEAPSLDPHWSGSELAADIYWHVVEPLFTLDARLRPVPMLAQSLETSGDGLTHTISLRRGVLFHNGQELTAEDVEASVRRWAALSAVGGDLFTRLDSLERRDSHTIVFRLKRPDASFAAALGCRAQGAAIVPAELVRQAAPRSELQHLVGTGPYRLAEYQRGKLTRLARWERYARAGSKGEGLGAQKRALIEEIRFTPVPDEEARVAGVRAGEFDYAKGVKVERYGDLRGDSTVAVLLGPPAITPVHHFNLDSPVTTDLLLRQAILAALDPAAALLAGWGHPDLFRLNGTLMPEESPWHSPAGTASYNRRDLEKARSLLQDSSYDGELIRYLTTMDYPTVYGEANAIAAQMRTIGLNVEVIVLDWSSLVSRRLLVEQWEIFGTWHRYPQDPSLLDWNNARYPGWWTGERTDALRDQLLRTVEPGERRAVLEKLQELVYEYVPALILGDVRELALANPRLKDAAMLPHTAFWNASFGG